MSKRRRYSLEFKRDAVRLLTDQGYSLAEAARSLGIHVNLLRNWRLKLAPENGDATLSLTEQEELKLLREENRRLRMERDILKKAAVYFAKESQ